MILIQQFVTVGNSNDNFKMSWRVLIATALIIESGSFFRLHPSYPPTVSVYNAVYMMSQHESADRTTTQQPRKLTDGVTDSRYYLTTAMKAMAAAAVFSSRPLIRRSHALENSAYENTIVNAPSDDFWYPPYMIGYWNTSMIFNGAKFTDKIPLDVLSVDNNVPGFTKYSIIFAPFMGKDIHNLTLRYVQIDSHPREDHPFNIRSLIASFLPDTVVDSAPYSFEKAPNWVYSPSNSWTINYHDPKGKGSIELLTRKRINRIYAGAVETIEFFRQMHQRKNYANPDVVDTITSEYAINWRIFAPASANDKFIKVGELAKTDSIVGALDILCFIQPTNDLYLRVPRVPAAVFSYNISMKRIGDARYNTRGTVYPFVEKGAGPVELPEYFGY